MLENFMSKTTNVNVSILHTTFIVCLGSIYGFLLDFRQMYLGVRN